jgi:hypothetical protein
MILTLAGVSGIALVIALGFMFKKVLKKFIPWLMLVAGLGLAGVFGTLVYNAVNRGVSGVSHATEKVLGAGVGGLAVVAWLTILLVPHMKPKGQPPTKFTPWLALIYPSVLAAVGGVLSNAAGLGQNVVTAVASAGMQFLASLVSG